MLKTLLLSLLILSLAGASAPAPAPVLPEWTWVQTVPNGTAWVTSTGRADVTLEGDRFEALLYGEERVKVMLLKGHIEGDTITGVNPYSPGSGASLAGLGPAFAGQRHEQLPQTLAVEGQPAPQPKRLWESITLTAADRFIGLTRP